MRSGRTSLVSVSLSLHFCRMRKNCLLIAASFPIISTLNALPINLPLLPHLSLHPIQIKIPTTTVPPARTTTKPGNSQSFIRSNSTGEHRGRRDRGRHHSSELDQFDPGHAGEGPCVRPLVSYEGWSMEVVVVCGV